LGVEAFAVTSLPVAGIVLSRRFPVVVVGVLGIFPTSSALAGISSEGLTRRCGVLVDGVSPAAPLDPVGATVPRPTGKIVVAVPGEAGGGEDGASPILAMGRVGGPPALTSAGAAETACASCRSLSGTEGL